MEAVQEYVVGGLSHNQSEALNILNSLLEVAAPSKEALVQLSTIPSFSTNNSGSAIGDSHVAFIFLRAASKHMPVIVTEAVGSVHHDNGLKDLVNLVSNLAGNAATFYQPRSITSNSGILSVFSILYDRSILRCPWNSFSVLCWRDSTDMLQDLSVTRTGHCQEKKRRLRTRATFTSPRTLTLDLAKAAHAGSGPEFAKVRSIHAQIWDADGNAELVAHLASDMLHRQVIQLASVFKLLPLSKMAVDLGTSEDCALHTLNQIATLKFGRTSGMIEFESGCEFPMTIDNAASLTNLEELVRKLDASTTKSSKYQSIKGESGRPPRGADDF